MATSRSPCAETHRVLVQSGGQRRPLSTSRIRTGFFRAAGGFQRAGGPPPPRSRILKCAGSVSRTTESRSTKTGERAETTTSVGIYWSNAWVERRQRKGAARASRRGRAGGDLDLT